MSMARAVSEDEAKRVWLSRLDVAWGKGVVAPVNQANEQSISEEEAKKAWLARLDAPTWGKSASTLTEIAKEALVVEQMYDTWYGAESWREFGYFDEHTCGENDSRDQKRYIEKQNKADRKKKQIAEKARMIKLVDNCYASDPRIASFKQQDKAVKDTKAAAAAAEKLEREGAKQAEADAAVALEQQAEAARIKAEKDAAEAARKSRKEFSRHCKKLEVVAEQGGGGELTQQGALLLEQVEQLRGSLAPEKLQEFCAITERPALLEALHAEIARAKAAAAAAAEAAKPWGQQEQNLLQQALRSVPKTAPDRWDQIAKAVPGRTKKACMIRVKQLVEDAKKAKVAVTTAAAAPAQWTDDELTALKKAANKVYPVGTTEVGGKNRWMQIADFLKASHLGYNC